MLIRVFAFKKSEQLFTIQKLKEKNGTPIVQILADKRRLESGQISENLFNPYNLWPIFFSEYNRADFKSAKQNWGLLVHCGLFV